MKRTEKVSKKTVFYLYTYIVVHARIKHFFRAFNILTATATATFVLCSLHIVSNWILLSRTTKKRTHFYYTLNTLSIKNATVNCLNYFQIFKVILCFMKITSKEKNITNEYGCVVYSFVYLTLYVLEFRNENWCLFCHTSWTDIYMLFIIIPFFFVSFFLSFFLWSL